MSTDFAGSVRVGDSVRTGSDPLFRLVLRTERDALGYIRLEVGVGAMVEKLPPLPQRALIEVDRADD